MFHDLVSHSYTICTTECWWYLVTLWKSFFERSFQILCSQLLVQAINIHILHKNNTQSYHKDLTDRYQRCTKQHNLMRFFPWLCLLSVKKELNHSRPSKLYSNIHKCFYFQRAHHGISCSHSFFWIYVFLTMGWPAFRGAQHQHFGVHLIPCKYISQHFSTEY